MSTEASQEKVPLDQSDSGVSDTQEDSASDHRRESADRPIEQQEDVTASGDEDRNKAPEPRERRPLVGPLPDDFLAIRRAQVNHRRNKYSLVVTIARGTLAKNHGALPMSLYAVVTAGNGATTTEQHNYCGTSPVWNTTAQFDFVGRIPKRLKVEIFDWGIVSDTMVAWGEVPLDSIFQQSGHLVGWYDLRGQDGHAGAILLDIVLKVGGTSRPQGPVRGSEVQQRSSPAGSQGITPSAEEQERLQGGSAAHQAQDLQQLQDMFPQLDREVLMCVYMANEGKLDPAIAQCLGMLAP